MLEKINSELIQEVKNKAAEIKTLQEIKSSPNKIAT